LKSPRLTDEEMENWSRGGSACRVKAWRSMKMMLGVGKSGCSGVGPPADIFRRIFLAIQVKALRITVVAEPRNHSDTVRQSPKKRWETLERLIIAISANQLILFAPPLLRQNLQNGMIRR
jgi:hypothetical protein